MFTYEPASHKLALRYTPASSVVSEVVLPDRAFPDGYDEAITGGCFDRSTPGALLVQANARAATVEVTVTVR